MSFNQEQTRCSMTTTGVQQESYDSYDTEKLREVVPMLRQQLEKSALNRNNIELVSQIVYAGVRLV